MQLNEGPFDYGRGLRRLLELILESEGGESENFRLVENYRRQLTVALSEKRVVPGVLDAQIELRKERILNELERLSQRYARRSFIDLCVAGANPKPPARPSPTRPAHSDGPSCFISCSSTDDRFAKRLCRDLGAHSIQCWLAHRDMRSEKIIERVVREIEKADRFLLILSRDSIRSRWVETEILAARQKERREAKPLILPIRLVPLDRLRSWTLFDSEVGEDVARKIREIHILDFEDWSDAEFYRSRFGELMESLLAGRSAD